MKKYTMLSTKKGSRDGLKVETFNKGETYDLNPELAEQFYHLGVIEEATEIQPRKFGDDEMLEEGDLQEGSKVKKGPVANPADDRQKKVIGPAETKQGEAGVDLDTQNIEELLALARDTYGLEVDSTMSEADLRKMIEQAQGDEEDDSDKKSTKTPKKPHAKK